MTKEEALIYLPIEEDEELVDVYEGKLFELKQFLSTNFPVTKVFNSKSTRIELLNSAYELQGGELSAAKPVAFHLNINQELFGVFKDFVLEKNRIRQQVMLTDNGNELIRLITSYLGLVRMYANVWKFEHEDFEGVRASVEPSLMELHEALKEMHIEGKESIFDVEVDVARNLLVTESKRLSLWLKLDSNV